MVAGFCHNTTPISFSLFVPDDLHKILFTLPLSASFLHCIHHRFVSPSRLSSVDFKRDPWPKVIVDPLSAEEVAGTKHGFDLKDTSKQGKTNIAELKAELQKVGQQIPDAALQILMDAGDVDKHGYLNYEEFVVTRDDLLHFDF
ncbi:unnamed protein product [Lactuca virosa]|uniref:EF-hand domain-containing protein n=1 Tax=Lactuca virosa TaxID=75947 RepID=A0AAU9NA86_9ASTR|nr:unnamed protein product [Lactuca virosa]